MKTIFVFKFVFLLGFYSCLTEVDNNIELTTSFNNYFEKNFNSMEMFIGNNNDSKISQMFHFDFGLSEIILGDINQVKWGIGCNEFEDKKNDELENNKNFSEKYLTNNKELLEKKLESKNSEFIDNYIFEKNSEMNTCQKLTNKEEVSFYSYSMFTYIKSEFYLRFKINEQITPKEGKKTNLQLITKNNNKWPLEKSGLIGLSPQGDFSNYLRANYKKDISFLFYYNYEKNNSTPTNLLELKSRVILNPRIVPKNIFLKINLSKDKNSWDFEADFEIEKTDWVHKKKKLCLTNSLNEIIISVDNLNMCDSVKKVACDNKLGNDCKRKDTNFDKLPNLIFKVKNKKIIIPGLDYIFFSEDDVLQCRFGDMASLRPLQGCDKNAEFAIGKIFFSKYYPVLGFNKDGTAELKILDEYLFEDKGDGFYWIIGAFIFLLVVSVIVFILVKKKRESDMEFYSEV